MDRWVEVDIDWFGRPIAGARTGEFVEQVAPLWRGADGDRGLMLNVGFLIDVVTLWSGDADQRLPLRAKRLAEWADATYGDLRALVQELKSEAVNQGLGTLLVGVFVAGPGQVVWPPESGSLYDLYGSWYERHPELYPLNVSLLPGPDLDPRVPLQRDGYRYAAFPEGLPDGIAFADVLAAQWGLLADFVGLDAILLRDGFLGPMLYARRGPYGTAASTDPRENTTWTEVVTDVCRRLKSVRPEGLVMLYSTGVGGTAEWRVGCVDVEAVVAAGDVDVFVDQTWGGAWQDWWEQGWKAWTHQVANLAVHGAMIRGANLHRRTACRHYKLIETWDGWEPWDTIHLTPGKLEWGIWALSHAATVTPDGLVVPDGSYVSWMNYRDGRLLDTEAIRWLADRLDAAEASAQSMTHIRGPLIVHDREAVAALHREHPHTNHSEWIEDQVGFLMKWGVAALAATRSEWLPAEWPDGLIVQTGSETTLARIAESTPVLVCGRASTVAPRMLAECGAQSTGWAVPAGYDLTQFSSGDLAVPEPVHYPERDEVMAVEGAAMVTTAQGGPVLTRGRRGLWWQPPDFFDPSNAWLPRHQIGSPSPYVEAARAFVEAVRAVGGFVIDPVAVHLPVSVHAWCSDGRWHVLVGNLETGWIGDSRHPREVTIRIPRDALGRLVGAEGTEVAAQAADGRYRVFCVTAPPQGMTLLREEAA